MIAPPYDVVGDTEVQALHDRSPHNIAHVESPRARGEDRYEHAAAALRRWESAGALRREDAPACYAYEQVTRIQGEWTARRSFFARLRLSPYEAGLVRPHERTMAAPKADRLALLRATRTNVSPILVLYRDARGAATALLAAVAQREPAFEATDDRGDRHRLWVLDDETSIATLLAAAAGSKITMADGHHRYETALGYLDERGGEDGEDEGARWVLAALAAEDDPGVVVLPTHRLVPDARPPADFHERLAALYAIEPLAGDLADLADPANGAAAARLWERVQAGAGQPGTFGLIGLERASLHLLRARSAEALDAAMPAQWSAASRSLDVLILNETILDPLLGIDAAALASGRVEFTEDVQQAWEWTAGSEGRLAFLINPTRVEQIVSVADAGELLPQKSTFFYPKLATGMVLNPLD